VAIDIDEEEIFPRFALGGAAFDFAHVDLEPFERLLDVEKRAGFVLHAKHD
jgi:hypothetical protein